MAAADAEGALLGIGAVVGAAVGVGAVVGATVGEAAAEQAAIAMASAGTRRAMDRFMTGDFPFTVCDVVSGQDDPSARSI
jgi:hypothetical protein